MLCWIGCLNPAFIVAGSIFLIYVFGLMTWSIGKPIREFFITLCPFFSWPHNKRDADLTKIINSTNVDLNKIIGDEFKKTNGKSETTDVENKLIYSYMWSKLSSVDNNAAKERIHFCNRYWVDRKSVV